MQNTQTLDSLPLTALIEALLFVSPTPLSPTQLANVLDIPARMIEKELEELENAYAKRGIRLQRYQGRVQLMSAPQAAPYIDTLLGLETTSRLSNAALETLSIIVFKQPITRPQIEAVRGVGCDGVLKNLLSKGLIEEVGRAETPGRPTLYTVTADFLQHFGLASLDELPSLEEAAQMLEALKSEQLDVKEKE